MKIMKIPVILFLAAVAAPSVLAANVPPSVAFVTTQMRLGTTLVDIDYRIEDPDDETVEVVVCAFKNGEIGFGNFIRVTTLMEGTQANVGQGIRTGETKRITWDVGLDWGNDNGYFSICVMPRDREDFLRIDWISIPGLTASTNSISDDQLLPTLYWFLSKGDSELQLNGDSLYWAGRQLKLNVGNRPSLMGRAFVYKRLGIGFLVPEDCRRMSASPAGFDLTTGKDSNGANPTRPWLVKRGYQPPGMAWNHELAPDGDYYGEIAAAYECEFYRYEWDYLTHTTIEIIEPCYMWIRMDGRSFYSNRNFAPFELDMMPWYGPRVTGAHEFAQSPSWAAW